MRVSVVIPAYQEAERIAATIAAAREGLQALPGVTSEILVVDDGSTDETGARAEAAGARVVRLRKNAGKGGALTAGFQEASGDVLLMLDADLGASAREAALLVPPLREAGAEMAVAAFPALGGGGFGLVKRLAAWGLRRAGAPPMRSPLSGQRAMTRAAWERIERLDPGFGLEMGLNLDAHRAGVRIVEVPTEMSHRVTGKDWRGFMHRGRQFRDILRAILRRGRGGA